MRHIKYVFTKKEVIDLVLKSFWRIRPDTFDRSPRVSPKTHVAPKAPASDPNVRIMSMTIRSGCTVTSSRCFKANAKAVLVTAIAIVERKA